MPGRVHDLKDAHSCMRQKCVEALSVRCVGAKSIFKGIGGSSSWGWIECLRASHVHLP